MLIWNGSASSLSETTAKITKKILWDSQKMSPIKCSLISIFGTSKRTGRRIAKVTTWMFKYHFKEPKKRVENLC